jgi:hypothetical protein
MIEYPSPRIANDEVGLVYYVDPFLTTYSPTASGCSACFESGDLEGEGDIFRKRTVLLCSEETETRWRRPPGMSRLLCRSLSHHLLAHSFWM